MEEFISAWSGFQYWIGKNGSIMEINNALGGSIENRKT